MSKLKRAISALSAVSLLAPLMIGIAASPAMAAPSAKGAATKKNVGDALVMMETTKGPIKLVVYKTEVPQTSYNFLDLVGKGFYNGLTFHRYEPGFCIQGGDPDGNGTGNYVDPKTNKVRRINLEIKPNLKHDSAGVLAMARSSDRNSASCQFYITLGQASFLDSDYAVFGRVVEGLDNVMALRKGDKMTKVTVVDPGK
ncbi:MAG: peptidyl-prolyl cis-trans isomerase [Cyanobacteriota bacterium erpe_2018_sw_21hr_WHONDRS-SW48-000092_B_bin.40]|nr:peptidyl-prolyl cis-trans isomerase [Cyanobacteriota bacterium erpe_2018_sw_21hr_WHONDRS-SW48-000092_B_bin.40]